MIVTGTSKSRLIELKNYLIVSNPLDNYKQSATPLSDGVNVTLSNANSIVYYVGSITYEDRLVNNNLHTFFSFDKNGIVPDDFTFKPIYKDPEKTNVISNPKVNNDVFIIRQELSAFNDNYKLEFINNLNGLLNYAGGNYFKIINNK